MSISNISNLSPLKTYLRFSNELEYGNTSNNLLKAQAEKVLNIWTESHSLYLPACVIASVQIGPNIEFQEATEYLESQPEHFDYQTVSWHMLECHRLNTKGYLEEESSPNALKLKDATEFLLKINERNFKSLQLLIKALNPKVRIETTEGESDDEDTTLIIDNRVAVVNAQEELLANNAEILKQVFPTVDQTITNLWKECVLAQKMQQGKRVDNLINKLLSAKKNP